MSQATTILGFLCNNKILLLQWGSGFKQAQVEGQLEGFPIEEMEALVRLGHIEFIPADVSRVVGNTIVLGEYQSRDAIEQPS